MSKYVTAETVSPGHPDKIADLISDYVLTKALENNRSSRVAVETFLTGTKNGGLVLVGGEISEIANISTDDVQNIVKEALSKTIKTSFEDFDLENLSIYNELTPQSEEIRAAVEDDEDQGAGDQGIMFGYASNETESLIPLALDLSHKILIELALLRREDSEIKYLRPDSKSQVTVEYDDNNNPLRIDTIVVSTQHDDFDSNEKAMLEKIKSDMINILIPRVINKSRSDIKNLFGNEITYHINPTGKFVIGGPHGDTGLTGRKIIVDTYGGKGAHGGGAFSGKDPSKVDRSAAYATRHIAKNLVAAGVADECLGQVSYASGVAKPMVIFVNTFGTSIISMNDCELAKSVEEIFELRSFFIERRVKLRITLYTEITDEGNTVRKS